jgi:hypothetical protein
MTTRTLMRLLFVPAPRKNKLPVGRCACHEPSVRWCTRHGKPLKAARARFDQLALT